MKNLMKLVEFLTKAFKNRLWVLEPNQNIIKLIKNLMKSRKRNHLVIMNYLKKEKIKKNHKTYFFVLFLELLS